MSIKTSVDNLSDVQKNQILKDLQFQNPKNKKWVYPFHVDEKKDEIFLPYAYARTLGFNPPSRKTYLPVQFNFTGTLRDYQKEIKKETIKELNKKGSIILSLHTGWGKSIFSTYIATKLGFKTLVIVNRIILVEQWKKLFENVCPHSKVQFIKTKKEMDEECDFYIINAQNVSKMGTEYFKDIACVLVDECHLVCAQTLYKALFHIVPKYVIGLSATPYRPDGLGILLDLYFGQYKIVRELYRKHTVYTIRTGIAIKYELQWNGKIDWNSVLNNQGSNPDRNQLIVDIVLKFSNRFFLILVKRIEQGKTLVDMLEERKESVTHLLDGNKDFDKEARIVIGTSQKCGVGFDHAKLDTLMIASDIEEYYIQSLGRVFRTPEVEPIVFDLVDVLPSLERHYKTRCRVYRKAGGEIKDVGNIRLL